MTKKTNNRQKRQIKHRQPEYIELEGGIEDAWKCVCGNTTSTGGFLPCDATGQAVEPTWETWTTDWSICGDCGRMIDNTTLEVVGRRQIMPYPNYVEGYDYNQENLKPCAVCGKTINYGKCSFISYQKKNENAWVCHHSIEETEAALGRKLDRVERAWVNGDVKLYLGRWYRKPVVKPR